MKAPLHRIIFYTADLKQRMMQLMRDFFALRKHQQVTVYHACEFLGITMEQLMPYIKLF
jgi:hypothetical protein